VDIHPVRRDAKSGDRKIVLRDAMADTGESKSNEWSDFRAHAFRFGILFVVVWLAFYTVYVRFPYLRNGADIIYSTKMDYVSERNVFAPDRRHRLAVFGDSRALASFEPQVFDAALDPNSVQSFNLGLPGDENFLPILERFLEAGNRPTQVLIETAWPDLRPPTLLSKLRANRAINQYLFPFHNLPRDLAQFAFAALSRRGIAGQYIYGQEQAAGMIANRGWYFIEGQSHFPDDQLPPDYALPTDTPGREYVRPLHAGSDIFQKLVERARQYDFQVWLVPTPFREHEFAPAPNQSGGGLVPVSGHEPVSRLGPDYMLLPARCFPIRSI
jgi:hypothetical protein